MSPMAKIDRPFHLRSVFELGSEAWGEDRFWNPTWIKFREAVTLPQCLLKILKKRPFVNRP